MESQLHHARLDSAATAIVAAVVSGLAVLVTASLLTGSVEGVLLGVPLVAGAAAFLGGRRRRNGAEARRALDLLDAYVGDEIASGVLSGRIAPARGGERCEVAVLFCDLRSYCTLAERLTPEELMALLNEYFDAMTPPLVEEHGTILEYSGDGFLAVFGAPQPLESAAAFAVRAAVRIRAALGRLAHLRRAAGVPVLDFGIGIHFGTVVAGNVGSAQRIKYAVVGDTVNVASRVQELTRELGCDVLITGEVRDRAGGDVAVEALGRFDVRGREGSVELYRVVNPPDEGTAPARRR